MWPTPLQADVFSVDAAALSRFALLSNGEKFGALEWRGGLVLSSIEAKFGGFSGLVLSPDCTGFTAISDRGLWFSGKLVYQNERLFDVRTPTLHPLRDAKGKPFAGKTATDTEALTRMDNGKIAVAFERGGKIGIYDLKSDGFSANYVDGNAPPDIAKGPFNGQLESLGYFRNGPNSGKFMAIAEKNFDTKGNTKAWAWSGNAVARFTIARLDEFQTTDVAIADNGDMYFLERDVGVATLPAMAIRFLPSQEIKNGALLAPKKIFSAAVPFYAIDNMEGLALCSPKGEQRLTVISDNNFSDTFQRTLLLQFAIKP